MNMNKYVKSLIKKYKNPSIIGEKSIEEVIAYLSEYYGQKIVCDPSIADEAFYGKLFLNEELKKVLESIWQTLPEDLGASRESIYVQVN